MDHQLAQLTVMQDLPNEMIEAILRELDLPDLINCRSVSRRFKCLIDNRLKIRDLFVFDNQHDFVSLNFLIQTPQFKYQLRTDFSIFKSPSFKSFSTSLKSLKICSPIDHPHLLNQFHSLERLYVQKIRHPVMLTLPKLRVLFIEFFDFKRIIFTIVSNVLEKLICERLDRIRLVHCGSVKQMVTTEIVFGYADLSKFKRLRILRIKIRQLSNDTDQYVNAIAALDDLTELHFDSYYRRGPRTKTLIARMVQWIWKRKPDLRIFWFGIELTSKSSARLIQWNLRDLEDAFRMQTENYEQLNRPLEDYHTVFYDHLSIFKNGVLPNNFKFSNIRSLLTSSLDNRAIGNPERFVKFVNSCKDLTYLCFNISGLNRAHFGRLSLNRLSMTYLELSGENLEIDCSFIFKLDYLRMLRIEQILGLETVIAFMGGLKYLRFLEFGDLPFVSWKTEVDSVQLIHHWGWSRLSFHEWVAFLTTIYNVEPEN